jgi:hypothetical protein
MQKTIQIESLPSRARRELMDFYEFLLQKYAAPLKRSRKPLASERMKRLQRIFEDSHGTLPKGYRFNRDEAHER